MDRISKILFCILLTVIAISVAATFYRFMILNEYDAYYDDYGEEEEFIDEIEEES